MDELQVRIGKFKRRASDISSMEHLQIILDSFPEERRAQLFQSVRASLNPKLVKQFEDLQAE